MRPHLALLAVAVLLLAGCAAVVGNGADPSPVPTTERAEVDQRPIPEAAVPTTAETARAPTTTGSGTTDTWWIGSESTTTSTRSRTTRTPANASSFGDVPFPTATASAYVDETHIAAEVVEVEDGDTIAVRYPDGSTDRVRLMGVDTPETEYPACTAEFEGVPNSSAGRSWLRHWGQRATNFTESRLAGAHVTLVVDETLPRRGFYGRLLAYVYVDGNLVNYDLLRTGHARLFDIPFGMRGKFAHTEVVARQVGVGLWNVTPDGLAGVAAETPDPGTDGSWNCPVG